MEGGAVAYESKRLKRVGTEELRYGVYELRLSEDETDQLNSQDSAEFLTGLLAEEGAPNPNEVVFEPTAAADWIDDIIKESGVGGTTPTPPPDPPQALLFHQENGAAASRYIVIVLSG